MEHDFVYKWVEDPNAKDEHKMVAIMFSEVLKLLRETAVEWADHETLSRNDYSLGIEEGINSCGRQLIALLGGIDDI